MLSQPAEAVKMLQDGGTGASRGWELDLALLLTNGFSLQNEPFLRATAKDIIRYNFQLLRTRARVPVDKGALLFGVFDPTGALQPGQVVIQLSHPSLQPELPKTSLDAADFDDEVDGEDIEWCGFLNTGDAFEDERQRAIAAGKRTLVVKGNVAVTRNPCLHPGDIRVLRAIEPPNENLRLLKDVIVFPQRGFRSHPSEMAFGDLDGDMFSVYFDQSLVPGQSVNPMEPRLRKDKVESKSSIDLEALYDFFILYLRNHSLGIISNAHAVKSDEYGIRSAQAIDLAYLASESVDFVKTGVIVDLAKEVRPEKFPDYMEKSDKPSYKSAKAIGMMFRDVVDALESFEKLLESEDPQKLRIPDGKPTELDPLLIMPRITEDVELCAQAAALCAEWNWEMAALLAQFGVYSETQLFTGAVLEFHRSNMQLDRDIVQKATVSVDFLKRRFRNYFEAGIERKSLSEYRMKRMRKASAWYIAAYSSTTKKSYKSFAWIMADELCNVKQFMINRTTRNSNKKEF